MIENNITLLSVIPDGYCERGLSSPRINIIKRDQDPQNTCIKPLFLGLGYVLGDLKALILTKSKSKVPGNTRVEPADDKDSLLSSLHRSLVGHTGPVTCLQFDGACLSRLSPVWGLFTYFI